MKDLVSIIVPVHNSSKYLNKCLDSILSQTYKHIEIIVIENGSTDNSLEILNNYKDKIKLEVLECSGLSQARNKGLELSKGEYIAFVDSDDIIEPNMIEELINSIKKTKSDLSCCDIFEIHESTNKIVKRNEYPKELITKEEIQKNYIKFNFAIWNKLYKKEIIEKYKIEFPLNLKYEDIPFVLSYLSKCNKISKVNKYLYNYLVHSESEQTTVDKRIFDIIKILDLCLTFIDKKDLEDVYVRELTTYIIKTRTLKDKNIKKEFINKAYDNLNKNYPDWKKCNYLKSRSIFKRIIQTNKTLASIYTRLYGYLHK